MLENVENFNFGYVVLVPPVVGAQRCTICDTVYPILGDSITGFNTWCNGVKITECPFCNVEQTEQGGGIK